MKITIHNILVFSLAAACTIFMSACGEKDDEEENGDPAGGCGFPEGGNDGDTTISADSPVVTLLISINTSAMQDNPATTATPDG